MEELQQGLYESLLTERLSRRLFSAGALDHDVRMVDPVEQPDVLARHVRDAAFRALSAQRDPERRVELVNQLLGILDQADDAARAGPRQLLALTHPRHQEWS